MGQVTNIRLLVLSLGHCSHSLVHPQSLANTISFYSENYSHPSLHWTSTDCTATIKINCLLLYSPDHSLDRPRQLNNNYCRVWPTFHFMWPSKCCAYVLALIRTDYAHKARVMSVGLVVRWLGSASFHPTNGFGVREETIR